MLRAEIEGKSTPGDAFALLQQAYFPQSGESAKSNTPSVKKTASKTLSRSKPSAKFPTSASPVLSSERRDPYAFPSAEDSSGEGASAYAASAPRATTQLHHHQQHHHHQHHHHHHHHHQQHHQLHHPHRHQQHEDPLVELAVLQACSSAQISGLTPLTCTEIGNNAPSAFLTRFRELSALCLAAPDRSIFASDFDCLLQSACLAEAEITSPLAPASPVAEEKSARHSGGKRNRAIRSFPLPPRGRCVDGIDEEGESMLAIDADKNAEVNVTNVTRDPVEETSLQALQTLQWACAPHVPFTTVAEQNIPLSRPLSTTWLPAPSQPPVASPLSSSVLLRRPASPLLAPLAPDSPPAMRLESLLTHSLPPCAPAHASLGAAGTQGGNSLGAAGTQGGDLHSPSIVSPVLTSVTLSSKPYPAKGAGAAKSPSEARSKSYPARSLKHERPSSPEIDPTSNTHLPAEGSASPLLHASPAVPTKSLPKLSSSAHAPSSPDSRASTPRAVKRKLPISVVAPSASLSKSRTLGNVSPDWLPARSPNLSGDETAFVDAPKSPTVNGKRAATGSSGRGRSLRYDQTVLSAIEDEQPLSPVAVVIGGNKTSEQRGLIKRAAESDDHRSADTEGRQAKSNLLARSGESDGDELPAALLSTSKLSPTPVRRAVSDRAKLEIVAVGKQGAKPVPLVVEEKSSPPPPPPPPVSAPPASRGHSIQQTSRSRFDEDEIKSRGSDDDIVGTTIFCPTRSDAAAKPTGAPSLTLAKKHVEPGHVLSKTGGGLAAEKERSPPPAAAINELTSFFLAAQPSRSALNHTSFVAASSAAGAIENGGGNALGSWVERAHASGPSDGPDSKAPSLRSPSRFGTLLKASSGTRDGVMATGPTPHPQRNARHDVLSVEEEEDLEDACPICGALVKTSLLQAHVNTEHPEKPESEHAEQSKPQLRSAARRHREKNEQDIEYSEPLKAQRSDSRKDRASKRRKLRRMSDDDESEEAAEDEEDEEDEEDGELYEPDRHAIDAAQGTQCQIEKGRGVEL
jgi:hypothetical protein